MAVFPFHLKTFVVLIFLNVSFSLVIRKRQSDSFLSNDFDASLVGYSRTNTGNGIGGGSETLNTKQMSYDSMNSNMGKYNNGGATGVSYGSRSNTGGGIDPFNSDSHGGSMESFGGGDNGNSMGSFSGGGNRNSAGPFSGGANGNSAGLFSGGANGNSAGPFSGAANGNSARPFSGGANGNSAGPFSAGANGNTAGPFSGGINVNSAGSFSGEANGNSAGPFSGGANGNSAGPFSGGARGNSAGPFSGAANGNSAGPFSGGANGNSAGPFSGGVNGNSAGPFSGETNGNSAGPFSGGTNGNSAGPFSGGANGNSAGPFAGAAKGDGMKSPFDSSNMKGGPGGMTGGMFSTNMGTSDGPGGLNGSPFKTNSIGDGGPGGLSGGSFLDNSGSTNDLAGTNLKFDTSQYEEMLKQMFATDSNKDEGSPFDPNSYSGDINKAGTGRPNSDGTNQYHRYNAGTSGSSYGSYSSGSETADPFTTKHFKDSASPFTVHQSHQIGSGSSSQYNNGLKSNSYHLTNDNSDSYQTPFNGHANYNELLSNPFQSSENSRGSGQGYQNPSMGRAYSPFKADKGMPGNTGMSNPGGNPFNQAGSQIGRG